MWLGGGAASSSGVLPVGSWLVAISPGMTGGAAGGPAGGAVGCGRRAVEMTVSPISTLGGMTGGEIAMVNMTGGAVAVVAMASKVVRVVIGSLLPRS